MRRVSVAGVLMLLSACVFDRSGLAPSPGEPGSGDRLVLLDGKPDRPARDGPPREGSALDAHTLDGPGTDVPAAPDFPWPVDTGPLPDTAPSPLFADDFTTAGGLQDDGTGSWSFVGGELQQTACIYTPESVVPGKSWADVAVRVRLRGDQYCTNYRQAGLVVRVKGYADCAGNQYYWCLADFDNEEIRIGKMNGACTTGNWNLKAIPAINLGVWYWMEFSAKGNTVTCKMWGGNLPAVQTHTFVDTGTPFASGSAGVVTAGLQATFDDFSVWPN